MGAPVGCRLQAGSREREKPGKAQGMRDICPEHEQEQGSGLFLSLQLGESLTHSLEILLRISYKLRPLVGSGDRQLCHLLSM